MHIENQIDGAVALENADQEQPRQERLACPGLAEDAVAALHKRLDVQAQLGLHVQRAADPEVAFVLCAEYQGYVLLRCGGHRGEVGRDGLRRHRAFDVLDEHGLDLDDAVGSCARYHAGYVGVGDVGRHGHEGLIGGAQGDIGDYAEEARPVALQCHEGADLHVLDRGSFIEPDLDAVGERPGHDHAKPLGGSEDIWFSHGQVSAGCR